jgi:sec-independent protein translocase protein TatA
MDLSQFNLALGLPGTWEWIVILIIGLMLFGKRLPEVGKSLGKGIVEFKKGLKGIEDEVDRASEEDQKDMLPPPDARNTANKTQSGDRQQAESKH